MPRADLLYAEATVEGPGFRRRGDNLLESSMLRTIRGFAGALLLSAAAAAPLFAAAPVFSNNFVSVTLDRVRLGTDTDPSNYSMFPTVVYDSSSGLFHMWVANTSALSIEGLRHATSSDGVHFVSDGNLSFAGGS